jgi:hypothetical protein
MNHELLVKEMEIEHKKWSFSTKVYGTLYPTIRFFLIGASGLVAAKESLVTTFGGIATWVAPIAVSVTIVTALDTWLKPRDKWRGFMRDRDDLATLRIRADAADPHDSAALDKLIADFAELRRRHRDENVW